MTADVPVTDSEYLASERLRYEHELEVVRVREDAETKRNADRCRRAESRHELLVWVAVTLGVVVFLVAGIGALYLNAEHGRAAGSRDAERHLEQARECVASGGTWLDTAGCVMPRRVDG